MSDSKRKQKSTEKKKDINCQSGVIGHIEAVFGPVKRGCPISKSKTSSKSTKNKKDRLKSSSSSEDETPRNLYEILGIDTSASNGQIRKAYFMMARSCHPDKCKDQSTNSIEFQKATAKFQALSMIHETLSNEEKRGYYDETGEIIDDIGLMGARDETDEDEETRANRWKTYFKGMFEEVTITKLDDFANTFIDSEEERQQIFAAYKESKGKITSIIDSVFFASDESEGRIRAILDKAIEEGKIKLLKHYKKKFSSCDVSQIGNEEEQWRSKEGLPEKGKKTNSKRKRKAEREAVEAEELLKKIRNKGGNTSLMSIRENRMRSNDDLVDMLMNKYVKKKK